jgi:catechol 2,3-dioxygenase-like lactoylglutathione lyase family enzyme
MSNANWATDLSLDHVGLIVPDLKAASDLWRALGFNLTSRADHTRTDAQGMRIPAGSSQHSVMLQQGYIELMQITDPLAGHPLTPAMQQRYGLHIVAIDTPDSRATHQALSQLGCSVSAVMDWSRPVKEGDFEGLAKFSFFDTPWQTSDASYVCWVQHLTPEIIRRPGSTVHANGAQALKAVIFEGVGADCAEWIQRLSSFGLNAISQQSRDLDYQDAIVQLGLSQLRIQEKPEAGHICPSVIQIQVDDVDVLLKKAQACQLTIQIQDENTEIDLGTISPVRLRVTSGRY